MLEELFPDDEFEEELLFDEFEDEELFDDDEFELLVLVELEVAWVFGCKGLSLGKGFILLGTILFEVINV